MVEPRITVNDKEVSRALRALGQKANIVMARAANRAATTANKEMSKAVRARYEKVKDGDVKKALFKRKATSSNPTAELTYKSSHENLYKLGNVTPKRIVKTGGEKPNPKFYKARVMKGNPFEPLMERPRPFVQKMSNGHIGLFRRKSDDGRNLRGKKRNAIEAVQAPALSQMLKNKEVLQETEKIAGEVLLKRLEHEIDRELRR